VLKFRGSATLRGRHAFRISGDGIAVFPRLEATVDVAEPASPLDRRLSTGVPGLDAMLGGGIPRCSTTGIVGAPGTGKTTLGLQFLAQCTPKEPGLLFGLFESPESLRSSASTLGIDLQDLEKRRALRIVWQPQSEHLVDELAHRLLQEVDAIKANRVFVDGYEAFKQATLQQERMTRFMTALSIKLRSREATCIVSAETDRLSERSVDLPLEGASPIFDNIVIMRRIERESRLVRLLSIIKVRSSDFDPSVHAFTIGSRGIDIGPTWDTDANRSS